MKLESQMWPQKYGLMRWLTLVDSAVGAGRLHIGNAAPMSGLGEGWWITTSYTQDAHPELTTAQAILARPDLFRTKKTLQGELSMVVLQVGVVN